MITPDFSSVLLTGANGFIGRALLNRLLQQNIHVTCLVRNKISGIDVAQCRQIVINEFTPANIISALQNVSVDVVFHLAAYGVHPQARSPLEMSNVNINSLVAILTAFENRPIKQIVHTGTCSEYAPAIKDQLIKEDYLLQPQSVYGASKVAANLYGRMTAQQLKLPLIHLRLFGVYGPGEADHRLGPCLIQKLSVHEPVKLSPGLQVRDFLYIDDVVNALIAAGNLPPQQETYNVCSSKPVTVRDFAQQAATLMSADADLLQFGELDYRKDETMWLVGDNNKFCRATTWKPGVSLSQGLTKMIAYGR